MSEPHEVIQRVNLTRSQATFVVVKTQRNLGSPMGGGSDDNSVILSTRVLLRQNGTGRAFVMQPIIAVDGHGATIPQQGETVVLTGKPISEVDSLAWPYLGEIWEIGSQDETSWWMMPKPGNYKIASGQRATPAEVIARRRTDDCRTT